MREVSVARSRWQILIRLAVMSLVLGLGRPAEAYQRPGATELASVATNGVQANESNDPTAQRGNSVQKPCNHSTRRQFSMSDNARYVAFVSIADNLVAGDTNGACDVFVHDRLKDKTERVSVSSSGAEAKVGGPTGPHSPFPDSFTASVSPEGRYVTFTSQATDLVPGDTNLSLDVFVHDRKTAITTRVSVWSDGSEMSFLPLPNNHTPLDPSISAHGDRVAFSSTAAEPLSGDLTLQDIFVHDLDSGKTTKVSVSSDGADSDGDSQHAHISSNGRYVIFTSHASNLRADATVADTIPASLYMHDLDTKRTELIVAGEDISPSYAQPLGGSPLSPNGRYVVFESSRSDLVPNDAKGHPNSATPGDADTFVLDRQTGRVRRVSVTSSGGESPYGGEGGTISGNGRFVMFASGEARFSSAGDRDKPRTGSCEICPDGDFDVYVYDLKTGALEWLSIAPDGSEADHAKCAPYAGGLNEGSQGASLSADGRYAAFMSCAPNLVDGDTNNAWDVFVRDRGIDLGAGGLLDSGALSLASSSSFAASGVASRLDEIGDVSALETRAGANLYGASLAYRPQYEDLFVVIELEYMPPVAAGASPIFYGFKFEAAGKSYEVRATSLLGGTFGLFDCSVLSRACTKIADLKGGYGTTGMQVVFALPLGEIGLQAGGEVSRVQAYTALGSYFTGPTRVFDRVALTAADS